jgi:subtilisin family serine protease/phosphatidylserine/phosphatidylglycerophosphate/cardiolipin synthase-like enzyme
MNSTLSLMFKIIPLLFSCKAAGVAIKNILSCKQCTIDTEVYCTISQKFFIKASRKVFMTHVASHTFKSEKADPFLSLSLFERDPQDFVEMEGSGIHPIEGITRMAPRRKSEPIISFTISYNGDITELARSFTHLRIRATAGNYATAEAPSSVIKQLLTLKKVRYLEASMPLQPELDKSSVEVRANKVRKQLGLTGKGVVVGIIDTGIDYTHPDFTNYDATSRILFLWDQNEPDTTATGKTPALFYYGKEYTKKDIDTALKSVNTHSIVPQRDMDGHGTHVAGIAAGNGKASQGEYIGMAPAADIIFVKYWSKGNLGDSSTLIDALDYIFRKADELGKPAVVNISMGNQMGPHDGTSQFELFVDKLVSQKAGRIVVKSAGNDGNSPLHGQGQVPAGGTTSLQFSIGPGDIDDDLISLWYETSDRFAISITSPTGGTSPTVQLDGNPISYKLANGNIVEIVHKSKDKEEQTVNSAVISVRRGSSQVIEEGFWSINVVGIQVIDGKFDAWIERIASKNRTPPAFINEYANAKSISLPGTSKTILTIGNYASGGDLANSSSKGPTRDGRIKPNISCPGSWVSAPLSKDSGRTSPNPKYISLSGTSMAAPTATGIVALMLEKQPSLSAAMVKKILCDTARVDSFTGDSQPNNLWGYGKIDAWAASYALPYNELVDLEMIEPGSDISLVTEISAGCEKTKNPALYKFRKMATSGKVTLFVSPDSTYQAVKELLDQTGQGDEILISFYDFSVNYVSQLVGSAIDRGAIVKLMIDRDKKTGSAKSEQAIIDDLMQKGAGFVWAPSCNNRNINIFTNCHQKAVIVSSIDENDNSIHPKKVMLSSGNWSAGGIPYNIWDKLGDNRYDNPRNPDDGRFKNGNREWGIIIEDEEIAKKYHNLLSKDFKESKKAQTSGVPEYIVEETYEDPYLVEDLYEEDIAIETPTKPQSPMTFDMTNVVIMPLMSPDNYADQIIKLIRGARESIKIQQQTISPNGKYGLVRSIMDALIEAKRNNPNLTIQFMRSSKFLNESGRRSLEELRNAECQVKFHNTGQLSHIHNKGIVVDGEAVVISSTNFTDTSIKENRECGVVIFDKNVAKYYDEMFNLDWSKGTKTPLPSPRIVLESDPRMRSNPSRYRRISLADIIDSIHE